MSMRSVRVSDIGGIAKRMCKADLLRPVKHEKRANEPTYIPSVIRILRLRHEVGTSRKFNNKNNDASRRRSQKLDTYEIVM